eukprot:gnl/Hemi2/16319_TR5431_c0_g1_i1.p1 gnl/Hemi2/16319_TR5431_c0_g1~~gnl/Hemi2/16319_TR5431_c0_g1_i1.p1  ORF type:complete len:132 (+),score=5.88 gnl/Hemi2/16319_TR5431_c0_g1_i1:122-517(+)
MGATKKGETWCKRRDGAMRGGDSRAGCAKAKPTGTILLAEIPLRLIHDQAFLASVVAEARADEHQRQRGAHDHREHVALLEAVHTRGLHKHHRLKQGTMAVVSIPPGEPLYIHEILQDHSRASVRTPCTLR